MVLNKYQSVTHHVSTCIFQNLFKNIVFRSVALVRKNLWAILFFFLGPDFFPPCTLPNKLKKKIIKNPLNYYSLKVTQFHYDYGKNEITMTKKLQRGAPNAPPPAC